ncbi:MAG: site-specific integrase [Nitrososphaerota archaeon]|jgi:integrase|nr:site-specific integrase [Nitrososphaerota archaeon]
MRVPQNKTYMSKFEEYFNKKLVDYTSFQRATTGLHKSTIKNYNTYIPRFCLHLKTDPDQIIETRKQDIQNSEVKFNERYEREAISYIKTLEKQGICVAPIINVIQGFFTNNSRRLALDLHKLKVDKENKNIKYSPSVDEVKKLIQHCDSVRNKLLITMIYQNGILPVDLANLKIGDYPSKPWVYYKRKRSKSNKYWKSASTPDICKYMEEYLILRKGQTGEPLFVGREGVLTGSSISEVLSNVIACAKLDVVSGFSPKCLRDGFNDALIDARVGHEVKEALMGHNADKIYHKYGSESKASGRLIEAMHKVYPLIRLTDTTIEKDDSADKALQRLISILPALETVAKLYEKGQLILQ